MALYITSSLCSFSDDISEIESIDSKEGWEFFDSIEKDIDKLFSDNDLGLEISREFFDDSEETRIVIHNSKSKKNNCFYGCSAFHADLSIEDDPTFKDRVIKALELLKSHEGFCKFGEISFNEPMPMHFVTT